MAFDPISAVVGIGETIIKRIWPDPEQQAKAMLEMEKLKQAGAFKSLEAEVTILAGQLEINKMEAMHGGLFKGGWRPFVGWVCGLALAYKFLAMPFLISVVQIIAHFSGAKLFPIEMLPVIEWTELSVILLGMLGIGGLRTMEKGRTK